LKNPLCPHVPMCQKTNAESFTPRVIVGENLGKGMNFPNFLIVHVLALVRRVRGISRRATSPRFFGAFDGFWQWFSTFGWSRCRCCWSFAFASRALVGEILFELPSSFSWGEFLALLRWQHPNIVSLLNQEGIGLQLYMKIPKATNNSVVQTFLAALT
jgi:hypothetical protein